MDFVDFVELQRTHIDFKMPLLDPWNLESLKACVSDSWLLFCIDIQVGFRDGPLGLGVTVCWNKAAAFSNR